MAGLVQKTELIGEELPWLSTLRKQVVEAWLKQGFPGAKTEAWKYTKPRALNADDYVVNTGKKQKNFPSKEKIDGKADVFEPLPEGYRICFENGIFNPAASDLPQGVEVLPLIEAVMLRGEVKDRLGKLVDLERHPFAALNTYYLQEGVYIRIEKNVALKKPLIIVNHTAAGRENLFFNLRNLIVLEEGAAAGLIEYYHYSGEVKSRYFCNVVFFYGFPFFQLAFEAVGIAFRCNLLFGGVPCAFARKGVSKRDDVGIGIRFPCFFPLRIDFHYQFAFALECAIVFISVGCVDGKVECIGLFRFFKLYGSQ